MSPRSWIIRVRDMLKAIDEVSAVLSGLTFDEFKKNRTAVLASVACIQILGEASKYVPEEIKQKYPEVPWAEVRGMRNRIIHEYFEVDEEVVWTTCTEDLPYLKPVLINIVSAENELKLK